MVKRIPGAAPADEQLAYHETLRYFFDFPNGRIGLTALSNEIGMAKTTANRVVTKLVKEGFLEKEVVGKAWLIRANSEHSFTLTRKIPYNLRNISESGLVEHINSVYPSRKAVVLFGSYRTGEDTDHSDVDIAVELYEGETRVEKTGVLARLGRRRDVPVNILVFSRATIDSNVFTNVANGIVLDGLLEVKP